MSRFSKLTLPALLLYASFAAAIDGESFADPNLERRYQQLAHELRCPKCQNQNIADSNAPIAADFRREVRDLLAEGKTDDEIKTFLTERYGDFVLYRPPLATRTLFVWFAPGLALIAGLAAAVAVIRRRAAVPIDGPLDDSGSGAGTP
jgi:cytochrome c-type biogenesis protein CcmH